MSINRKVTVILGVWLLMTLPMATLADTSDSYDIERNKVYGNCRVWTAVDMLTDHVLHHLECSEETMTDVTSIRVTSQHDGGFDILLSKGAMFIMDELVPVAYRIDKGKLIKGRWLWVGELMSAKTAVDKKFVLALLDELAKGERIAIQVVDERGNVILDGAGVAVKDFRDRLQS